MSDDSGGFFGLIFIVALIVGLTCLVHSITTKDRAENDVKSRNPEVIVVDGCEYFRLPSYSQFFTLTHKGNCTNSFHYVQKLER